VPTRRRTLVAEVEELDQRGRVQRVLDTFGRHRLLSFDRDPVTRGPTVEISHEALLTEWAKLREWIEAARDDLRTHRHLVVELNAWLASGKSGDFLLQGGRLDSIAAWSQTTTMGLRPPERDFLDASLAARAEDQQVRQVEQRRTTDAERRARRRSRQLWIAALTAALVAVLAVFAWAQRQDARDAQAELSGNQEAQRLANLSASTLSSDPQLSLLLAMEAIRSTAKVGYAVPEAVDSLHWALQEIGAQYDAPPDALIAARLGPGGVRGVWALSVDQLMALAEKSTVRRFSSDECGLYFGVAGCPADVSVAGLQYLGGLDTYANSVALDKREVVVGTLGFISDEWQQNLDAVAEKIGVRIRAQGLPDLSPMGLSAQGLPSDIFVIDAKDMPELSAVHPLLDLRAFLDEATLLEDYGAHLLSLSRIGDDGSSPSDTGSINGVFASMSVKSLVWTDEPEFSDLGYARPSDWASFMNLGEQMLADGKVPLCLGVESGVATGWPATDWVETIVLRTAGPDFYEQWINHEVPFDDPIVVSAIRTIGEMVFSPGFLDTTPAEVPDRPFQTAAQGLVTSRCMMTLSSQILPGLIDSDDRVGAFAFPGFGLGHDDAVMGSGNLAVAVTDRPEVRQVMAALASPDFGARSAQLTWPENLPANTRFDTTTMANPVMGDIVKTLVAAVRADEFRFDASDSMPAEIGDDAFWHGMVRLFREGSPENLDQLSHDIASEIEAAWVELEQSG
jgi:alpha-glucoside transport system substrate-binding protein